MAPPHRRSPPNAPTASSRRARSHRQRSANRFALRRANTPAARHNSRGTALLLGIATGYCSSFGVRDAPSPTPNRWRHTVDHQFARGAARSPPVGCGCGRIPTGAFSRRRALHGAAVLCAVVDWQAAMRWRSVGTSRTVHLCRGNAEELSFCTAQRCEWAAAAASRCDCHWRVVPARGLSDLCYSALICCDCKALCICLSVRVFTHIHIHVQALVLCCISLFICKNVCRVVINQIL